MLRAYPAELLKATLGVIDGLDPILGFRVTSSQGFAEGLQPRIELDNAYN